MTHYDVRLISRRPPYPMRVLLDGTEVVYAVAADDVNGWVEVYITNPDGTVRLFGRELNPHPRTKVLYGVVTFEEVPKEKK